MSHLSASIFFALFWACFALYVPVYAQKGGEEKEAPVPVLPPALQTTLTNNYVTIALTFPPLSGLDLSDQKINVTYEKGYCYVAVFMASWCVSCQRIIEDLKKLAKKYDSKPVRFYYVFSHDIKPDVLTFVKQTGLTNVIIAGHDALKEFHNPELPSIYLSDRDGSLLTRFLKADQKSLQTLETLLYKQTIF